MKPLERAFMPPSETQKFLKALRAKPESVRKWLGMPSTATAEDIEHAIQQCAKDVDAKEYWRNDKFQVSVFDCEPEEGFPEVIHLSIKRLDRAPIFSWRDIQAIKNQVVGPENEGVQLFPAESRLVDGANQYHLFVLKDPTIRFPFGFAKRMVTDEPIGKSINRAIENNEDNEKQ